MADPVAYSENSDLDFLAAFCAFFHAWTSRSLGSESTSAAERGWPSLNAPAAAFHFGSADTEIDGFWDEIGWVTHYHGEVCLAAHPAGPRTTRRGPTRTLIPVTAMPMDPR